jgi:PAS domain S-box-containing protein
MKIDINLLNSLNNSLDQALLIQDENLNNVLVSDSFRKLFTVSPDSGTTDEGFYQYVAEGQNFKTLRERYVAEKQKRSHVIHLFNGKWVELTYIPVFVGDKFNWHVWRFEDISARRKTEGMLMSMSNIQHTLLNGVNYSIIYTDTTGTIISFNRGAEQLLGYKAEDLVGKETPVMFHSADEIQKRADELSSELKRQVEPGFEVLIALARHGIVETREWTYISAAGLKLTVSLSVSSIRNDSGEISGYLGISRDITHQKYAENALKYSERRYQNIIENSSEIIYKTDKYGYFTFVNPVSERITGYQAAELLSMSYLDLVRPDKRDEVQRFYVEQVANARASTYYEFPIITKTCNEVWIGQSLQVSMSEDGSVELVALAIDITRQKVAEKKIVETNQELVLFKNLINNTSDAIQVVTEQGQLLYVNNEASYRLGIVPDNVAQYRIADIDPMFAGGDKWEEHVRELKVNEVKTYESVNVHQGTKGEIPVEVVVRYIKINDSGYILSSARDITIRRHAEKVLKAQEEKYRNIIENMKLGLLEVDLNENIQYYNRGFAAMSGFTDEDLMGKNAAELFAKGEAKTVVAEKNERRARGEADMYEVLVKNNAGEEKWWMISGAPNYNDEGKMIGSIGIHLDITEQKKLTQQLEGAKREAEEASEAKEAFLANMSHEIRTPLNGIIGMIRELSYEDLGQKQKKYVNNAAMASQHLLAVLNNILDISKIRAGELVLENYPFSLADTLKEVKQIMNASAREKGLILSMANYQVKEFVYMGDAFRIRQILLNLVGNSIKFTKSGGVYIECKVDELSPHSHRIRISVEDTGIGMEENYMRSIFKKFSQEDSSTSRKFGGSGLGMAITYELIQLMNGDIGIKSTKNVGTTVEISFTLETGKVDPADVPRNEIVAGMLAGRRILLVEDNDFNRAVARKTLERYECEVTEAENGKVAIELLEKDRDFDVILMDLQMPELDGIEATRLLMKEKQFLIPVIALTANAFKSEIELCRQVGFVDYITKPFDEHVMLGIISQHLRMRTAGKKPAAKETLLYDLKNLRTIGNGDESFVSEMVKLFIDQTRSAGLAMQQALTEGNYLLLSQLAHKIKPSIDNMGIVSLKEKIRQLEIQSKQQESLPEITALLEDVNQVLAKVIVQLEAEKQIP